MEIIQNSKYYELINELKALIEQLKNEKYVNC